MVIVTSSNLFQIDAKLINDNDIGAKIHLTVVAGDEVEVGQFIIFGVQILSNVNDKTENYKLSDLKQEWLEIYLVLLQLHVNNMFCPSHKFTIVSYAGGKNKSCSFHWHASRCVKIFWNSKTCALDFSSLARFGSGSPGSF